MNEAKVREVLDYCREQAHDRAIRSLGQTWDQNIAALRRIEAKIKELTDDDLPPKEPTS